MAFYTNSLSSPKQQSRRFFQVIVSVLQRLVTAQNKSTEVQRMRALSDQQLAQMGMTRTDIVRNAYRNFSVT